jgi:UDP-N-acetylmuramoylalanine--D-glutamate ligase
VKALVLGCGRSGKAAGEVLRARGYEVSYAEGVDLVVASPGIPVRSELQFGVEALRALGVRLLAVTGSKGKSSVVKVVADAINLAGMCATPCGNYGLPVSELASQLSTSGSRLMVPTWAVVEVSSFQMETTDDFRPEAAALLNLQEDHLDRHGTKEAYHALKRRLLALAERELDCSSWTAADVPADARALFAGSYFDNEVLAVNGAAAVWLMRAAGLADAAVAAAFASFEPLPHRMQTVCERGGVRYIDDSKATSLAALAAGTRMAGRPVRLIAGGLGKGDDAFSSIRYLQSTTKKVYLIGRCANQLYDAWHSAVPCEMCGTLEAAVAAASRDARPGEAVLLSPGAASFDQFKNFGARGDRFAALVMKERQKNEC